jgi:16S rRNA (uracil1498-N3)-methyltransferase
VAKPPPRLFVEADLAEAGAVPLSRDQAHYLTGVLRHGEGDGVFLFNGRQGEWRATLARVGKRDWIAQSQGLLREQTPAPALDLLFAPLKKGPTEMLVQKATELGVGVFQPTVTQRTIMSGGALRTDRLDTIATEAAEQCERLDIPTIMAPQPLDAAIAEPRTLIFCDEAGNVPGERWDGAAGRARPIAEALGDLEPGPVSILIGPEGGFTPEERELLRQLPHAVPVSLGPRILKAETAALAAISIWQGLRGDWR